MVQVKKQERQLFYYERFLIKNEFDCSLDNVLFFIKFDLINTQTNKMGYLFISKLQTTLTTINKNFQFLTKGSMRIAKIHRDFLDSNIKKNIEPFILCCYYKKWLVPFSSVRGLIKDGERCLGFDWFLMYINEKITKSVK